ncbi:MAG: 30S ribosome-binding factor RbfA [Clostridia bacterium]|nr:30S ribosome-binding factor RbfA [Clostridia bacterium]
MANYKRDRRNEEIRREIAEILKDIKDPRIPPMPSVNSCDVTGDLEEARVYVSFFTKYDEKEVKQGLKASAGYVRKQLAERLNMRNSPKIYFILDHSVETGARINEILKGLNNKDSE